MTDETLPVIPATRLGELPPLWPHDLLDENARALQEQNAKLVVVDDDPTGTQTVYDIPVITQWDEASLRREFAEPELGFFILTNSRSLPSKDAELINTTIGRRLRRVAGETKRPVCVVSRSDSTLRGHFPTETDSLARGLGEEFDATLIIPYFGDGGRVTVDDVHYVRDGERLVPAAQTPFAQDRVFGFTQSDLRKWVEEKAGGEVSAGKVVSISIDDLRKGGPQHVVDQLRPMADNRYVVVNAADDRDVDVLVSAVTQLEAAGKRFLFRTAASFVSARLGQSSQSLLHPDRVRNPHADPGTGGLVVAGSYVPKTTRQLERLLDAGLVAPIELDVGELFPAMNESVIEKYRRQVQEGLASGKNVALYTSRELLTSSDTESDLEICRRVSTALVRIVHGIELQPRFLIAKGGITSSDIATHACDVRRAIVLGQAITGVPVWKLGPESRYPDLPYVVFPGNVGDDDALADLVARLHGYSKNFSHTSSASS